MPGFDGTGPFGKGPYTGRGLGYCGRRINLYRNKPKIVEQTDKIKSELESKLENRTFGLERGLGRGPCGGGRAFRRGRGRNW